MPLQLRHRKMPWFTDAHCGLRVTQSAHTCAGRGGEGEGEEGGKRGMERRVTSGHPVDGFCSRNASFLGGKIGGRGAVKGHATHLVLRQRAETREDSCVRHSGARVSRAGVASPAVCGGASVCCAIDQTPAKKGRQAPESELIGLCVYPVHLLGCYTPRQHRTVSS